MRLHLVAWLACPCCGADLKFSALEMHPRLQDDVEAGELSCTACPRKYPIRGGIPRLRPPEDVPAAAAKTRESFGYEWLRYPGSRPVDEPTFLEETMLKREDFKDKLVLDAGCGMGRYAAVARSFGAEVVAADMSDSLIRVAERAKDDPKLHPVECDLLRPPFKKAVFDLGYSQGVLHHTADTKTAFLAVAALIKPGGKLSVWLYGKAGRFADFATNPIRPGREWVVAHRRLAWWIVLVRHILSDTIRVFTTRLPVTLVYALCYPLTLLGMIPGVKYLTFSVDPDFQARLIENFDWISPPYQWHHTKEELQRWFWDAGFTTESLLPHGLVPKPGVMGRKKK